MSDAFDENALMDRVDDDVEFLEETVTMLDEDSPALLEQIRVAAASGDAAALVKPAHALKGMLAVVLVALVGGGYLVYRAVRG